MSALACSRQSRLRGGRMCKHKPTHRYWRSKTILCIVKCLHILFALPFQISLAQAPEPSTARLSSIVQADVEQNSFMGTVIVERKGKVLLDQGYGSADLEWDIPNTPATRFRLGSLTKQFTAASILVLEQRGQLNVTDPISKYLPDCPDAWRKITIFHLPTHTSGIPDWQQKHSSPDKIVSWMHVLGGNCPSKSSHTRSSEGTALDRRKIANACFDHNRPVGYGTAELVIWSSFIHLHQLHIHQECSVPR